VIDLAKLRAQLVEHEALRFWAYDDKTGKELRPGMKLVGNLTIGVGHNLNSRGISDDVAALILEEDIIRAKADLDRAFPFWSGMSEVRQRVLLEMCFAMGITRLSKFKNTLQAMSLGLYDDAARGMLASLWAREQAPKRARRLAKMMRDDADHALEV
jgi:lysozyme